MWDRLFLGKLRKELPRWSERGWISAENQAAILKDVSERFGSAKRTPLALAILGALLFGAGAITFVAANWDVIPKLGKLSVLFGSMWVAYGIAARLLVECERLTFSVGQAFLLLGVLLYGANIMLVAQIYHIQAHFPDGVLLWALGALVLTYLVPSQVVTMVGIVLAAAWGFMERPILFMHSAVPEEMPVHHLIHWPFLLLWLAFIPQICMRTWTHAARLGVLSFLAWCGMALVSLTWKVETAPLYVLQVALLASLVIFLIGALVERIAPLVLLSLTIRHQAVFAGLVSFYGTTLRIVQGIGESADPVEPAPRAWIVGTVTLGLLIVALLAVLWPRLERNVRRGYASIGYGVFAVLAALMFGDLFIRIDPLARYISFNLLYLGALVWLVYTGYGRNDRFQVNISFLFFAAGLLTLYFDTFWALLHRSFFFMGAGIVLLGGGYLLERQRRRLVARMPTGEEEMAP